MQAHHAGDHGFGRKAPDSTEVPFCVEHHLVGRESAHRMGRWFWSHWRIDRDELIARLHAEYEETTGLSVAA